MLQPKRTKYRRPHIIRYEGKATAGNHVDFGEYGLQALEPCWITANQLEAGRIAINRCFQRGGKVWIDVFPDKQVYENSYYGIFPYAPVQMGMTGAYYFARASFKF